MIPIHLIIEGADGLGKSTICKELSKQLKIDVVKMPGMTKYFKNNPEEASEIYNRTVIQHQKSSFIQDRGWPTSIVYSKAYNREVSRLKYLKEIQRKLNETIIVLVGDKPFRGDKLVNKKEWKILNDEYTIFFDSFSRKGDLLFNVSYFTPKQICHAILQSLNL